MADPWGFSDAVARANTAATGVRNERDYWSNFYKNQFSNYNPTPIRPNFDNQSEARGQQANFLQQLHRLAQGDPNSLAQQMLRQSTQTAQGQLAGGIAARGNFGGAGAAMRQARMGQQAIGASGVDQSNLLMKQEQAAAQQALAQALAAQRQQDIGQAGMASDAALKNSALNDAMSQFYFGQGIGTDINALQREQDRARAQLGFELDSRAIDRQTANQMIGAGAGLAGTGMNFYNNQSRATNTGRPGYAQQTVDDAFNGW